MCENMCDICESRERAKKNVQRSFPRVFPTVCYNNMCVPTNDKFNPIRDARFRKQIDSPEYIALSTVKLSAYTRTRK